MITGAAQMDGAILVVLGARRPDAADARARAARPPGRRAGDRRLPEQVRLIGAADQELLDLVEMEVRELLTKYKFPGDDTPIIRGAALKALEGDAGELGSRRSTKLLDALRHVHPGAGARDRQAVPDAGRRRVLDHGPRHRGHGPHRARHRQGRRRSRDRRLPRHDQDDRHGRRDVPQAARPGAGGRQRRRAPARHQEGRSRARPGARPSRAR